MEVRTGSIAFGRARDVSPRTATQDEAFDRNVSQATAVLTGAEFGFSPNDDHHLGEVDIKVDSNVLGTIVRVTATLGVRDWSGDVDDDYEGAVFYAVLAELA
jgi:hypothetical protein